VKVASAQHPLSEVKGKGKPGTLNLAATSKASIRQLLHSDMQMGRSSAGILLVPTTIPPKISTLFSTFSRNACHWVVMHGTLQGMSSIHGLKRMAVPLELPNLSS